MAFRHRGHECPQPNDADELLRVIDDVEIEGLLDVGALVAQELERFFDRPVAAQRHDIREHDAAGAVLRVGEQLLDRSALFKEDDDLLLPLLGQVLDDVGGDVLVAWFSKLASRSGGRPRVRSARTSSSRNSRTSAKFSGSYRATIRLRISGLHAFDRVGLVGGVEEMRRSTAL